MHYVDDERDLRIPNFYEELNIPRNLSRNEINNILNEYSKEATNTSDRNYIELAREYLIEHKNRYDKYLDRHKIKRKKERKKKLIKGAIAAGLIVAIGIGAGFCVKNIYTKNKDGNVCVEYKVVYGDKYDDLKDTYELYDIGFTHYESEGAERQEHANEANQDIYGYLEEGDVIAARTTKENADKFVEEKGAKIESVDKVVEDLEKNDSLSGEFKKVANGESNMTFYEPTTQKSK